MIKNGFAKQIYGVKSYNLEESKAKTDKTGLWGSYFDTITTASDGDTMRWRNLSIRM